MTKKLLTLVAVCFLALSVSAEKYFNASLTPDIAIFPKDEVVKGLTLSIWGENTQQSLALGLVNGSTKQSTGLSIGLINNSESYAGVELAFFNYNKENFVGWQAAAVNYSEGFVKGLQTGAANYADKLTGLQIGVLNVAKTAEDAVQIGLINVIKDKADWFEDLPNEIGPAMVFVNWSF